MTSVFHQPGAAELATEIILYLISIDNFYVPPKYTWLQVSTCNSDYLVRCSTVGYRGGLIVGSAVRAAFGANSEALR